MGTNSSAKSVVWGGETYLSWMTAASASSRLRSARRAEDDGQTERFRSDTVVDSLLRELERDLELRLGEETLADFLRKFEDYAKHEDSLV